MRTQADILEARTFRFALDIVKLVRGLPSSFEARRIGGQLFDAGTSVGANYRAASKARSHAEFVSKIGIVVEEADESGFWMDLLVATSIVVDETIRPLRVEASELTAIFTASHKTASNRKRIRTTNGITNSRQTIDNQ